MLNVAASSVVGIDRRKLEALLAHFEDGLRDEMFFLSQRDTESLLALIHRQGEVLAAILDLTGGRITDPALRRRWTAILTARDAMLRATESLMEAVRSELTEIGRSAARLRRVCQASKAADTPAAVSKHLWAA